MAGFPPHPDRRPAVVTGASAGIGAAVARMLAAAGHPVALGARNLDRCERTALAIREAGGEAVALRLDVGDTGSVARFRDEAARRLGGVEILVSNAGTVGTMRACGASTEELGDEINVNVLGAHRVIDAFVPGMVERARGDAVFVSSDVVRTPRPGVAGYVAGKWGLEGLVRSLQMELEGAGVRASLVRPGQTATGIADAWDHERMVGLLEDWQRWGLVRHGGVLLPDDVARAVVAVVSAPRGAHLSLVEVQPEAPIAER
jgi:NADP-dependent 3-hydroxy acid dehydrogenase YdfG